MITRVIDDTNHSMSGVPLDHFIETADLNVITADIAQVFFLNANHEIRSHFFLILSRRHGGTEKKLTSGP
ncbi:hypothetical protein THSYN_09725 [Candidatus Thiodictyon syntrophicum]|uniref:Uncharacterized protein n=1 Tax=Candidatus Thiodictyon syntrophicum TaxID=1166950 RepID=A0A2K8U6I7_9GAMM|nr:hypothetical protein THSYN_09725 [Candidatus Thiodictyon syntrophicum]